MSNHLYLAAPANRSELLTLPTNIPSLWSMVRPSVADSWVAPFIVLILQVWLTGGFYGSLIRINARQTTSLGTFVTDAFRSFWRLFLWYLLWTGLNMLLSGIVTVFPLRGVALAAGLLILRFLFLFGDVALVAERNILVAFRSALGTLFSSFFGMLPYGVVIAFGTSVAMWYATQVNWLVLLLLGIAYCVILTWVLHMVTARYLYYSQWTERSGYTAVAKQA